MILTIVLTAITLMCICGIAYSWAVRPKQDPPAKIQTLEMDGSVLSPLDGYVMLPSQVNKKSSFTDTQVKPIKGAEGWSSVSFKLNDRNYRLDMEDDFAKELEQRLS